jgi:hypothetical protein
MVSWGKGEQNEKQAPDKHSKMRRNDDVSNGGNSQGDHEVTRCGKLEWNQGALHPAHDIRG